MTKITLGKLKNTESNRQIKILGRTHVKKLRATHQGEQLRTEINRFKNLQGLISGDLKKLQKVTEDNTILTDNEITKLFCDISGKQGRRGFKFKMTDGSVRFVSASINGKKALRKILEQNYMDIEQGNVIVGSDHVENIRLAGIQNISVVKLKEPVKKKRNKNGHYFKYINTTDIDLTRYQIVKESDDFDILNENCLIYALRQSGITEDKLNRIKSAMISGSYIAKNKLKQIADMIGKKIKLYSYRNNRSAISKCEWGKFDDYVEIAIFEDHFFIYEPTIYSHFSIDHYDELKDIKDFNKVVRFKNGMPDKANGRKANSLQLINNLFRNGKFNGKSPTLTQFVNNPKIKSPLDIPLSGIENEQRLIQVSNEETEPTDIFYADTEAVTTEGDHWCLLVGIVKSNENDVKIYTYDRKHPHLHIKSMLNYIYYNSKTNNPIVYFHNLKYDFNVLRKHLYIIGRCEKNGSLYSVDVLHNGKKITLKDSYKLFNSPLRDFCSAFGLPDDLRKKEAIGYDYYNSDTIQYTRNSVKNYCKYIKPEDKEIFMNALRDNRKIFEYDEKNGKFNAMNYYRHYLKFDCLVLKAGFEVLHKKMLELTKLNIHNYLTISSLANRYFKINGAFDGVYEVAGNLREYISKAIYGGRVAVLESILKKVIKEQLVDYDACSLYSSAIERMCREIGIPKGPCKQINKFNKKELDKYNYYIVTIRINKINKKQQIPFIAIREEGILNYTNEIPDGGLLSVVDSITLDDYIKFHKIDYEILDGVYWNSGTNKKFGQLANKLYNDRIVEKQKAKKANTANERKSGHIMQNLIKLMLNSSYGKTITSKTKNKTTIMKTGEKCDDYIYNNFHTIIEVNDLNDKQKEIKYESIDDSFNLAHIGVMVLSMSKRIMNEVMDIANENKIKVYYQDTDSMHIERSRIQELEQKYEKQYGRVLNGNSMGNFHSDFDLKGADQEPYSTTSIFLGKKCYFDQLECINSDGTIITGSHIRLKGITQAGIDQKVEEYGSPYKLFKALSKGEHIEFTLNPQKFKPSFNYNSHGVETRAINSFTRELVF